MTSWVIRWAVLGDVSASGITYWKWKTTSVRVTGHPGLHVSGLLTVLTWRHRPANFHSCQRWLPCFASLCLWFLSLLIKHYLVPSSAPRWFESTSHKEDIPQGDFSILWNLRSLPGEVPQLERDTPGSWMKPAIQVASGWGWAEKGQRRPHLAVPPKASKSQGWASLKPKARNPIWVFPTGGRDPRNWAFTAALQCIREQSQIRSREAGIWTSAESV